MRTPSRRMLAAPVHKTPVWAYPIFLLMWSLMLIGICYGIYRWPYGLLVIVAIAIYAGIETVRTRRIHRRLVSERTGASICSFARAFDCQHTDTWVIRAVYEELSRLLSIDGQPFPILADDHFYGRGLKIDPEDLDDLVSDIAFRARRSLDGSEKNPFYGRVETVRDMVAFLQNQPRLDRAESTEDVNKVL
jgi:hypothetical protein